MLEHIGSYDLGRVLEHLHAELAERPTAYGPPALRQAVAATLRWDQRQPTPWHDPQLLAAFTDLRAALIPEGSPHDYPLSSVCSALAALLEHRLVQEREEPF